MEVANDKASYMKGNVQNLCTEWVSTTEISSIRFFRENVSLLMMMMQSFGLLFPFARTFLDWQCVYRQLTRDLWRSS